MRAVLEPPTVHLELEDTDEARRFFDTAASENGFLVTLGEPLKQFASHPFHATTADGSFEFGFEARVLQVFPDGGGGFRTAFELAGWGEAKRADLARSLRDDTDTSPTLGTSPMFQIREMNLSQKVRLAMKASRTERQILLRDSSPQVLMALLSNPRLEDEDVLQIAKSTHSTSGILKRIASNRRWASNLELQTAIVRNPKTPLPMALRLLESLRTPDLQVMAKSSHVRESLRKAALKIYLKRVGR